VPPAPRSPRNPFAAAPRYATEGLRVAAFIERYCRHSKGKWAGQRIVLEDWQRWALNEIFRVDPQTGYRYWRQVLWMIPRKNAKSTIISAVGHYLLGFDGEGGPEVFSAAWGAEQAGVTMDAAKAMAEMSPKLRSRTTLYANEIRSPRNRGVWKRVSKLADMQQGTNPHAALIDEYHVHKRSDLFDAFKRGTQAREQPMILIITTEADDDTGPLGMMQEGFAADHVERKQVTPYLTVAKDHRSRSLMIRWGLAPDATVDISDPAVVRGCNPAGWLDPKRLIDEYLHAPGALEHDFRRFHLNQLVTSEEQVIKPDEWDACRVDGLTIPDGAQAYSGTDLGFTGDWSAHAIAAEVDGRIVLQAQGWEPPGDGQEIHIRATVDEYARAEAERLSMQHMLVDKWNARLLMQDWQLAGLPVGMFSMENEFMCPASQTFLEAVRNKRIAHDGDPELRRHVLNMRRRTTGQTSWKFAKHPRNDDSPEHGHFKTDVAFAAVAAVYQVEAEQASALETHGIFI
jgi:phage terminase large subunit-like protein